MCPPYLAFTRKIGVLRIRSNSLLVLLVLPASLLLWACTLEDPPDDGESDGATLYNYHCVNCHQPGNSTDIQGKDENSIIQALNTETHNQSRDALTSDDIRLISSYLQGTPRLTNSTWVQGITLSAQAVSGEVTIKDTSGAGSSGSVDPTSGAFAIDVSALTAPYVLQFSTAQDGNTLYSYASVAGISESGIANITPITDMVVREASSGGDIDRQFNDCPNRVIQPEPDASCFTTLSDQGIADTKRLVNTRLASEMEQAGIDPEQFDAMTTPIDDQQIDLLQILEANGVID